MTNDQISPARPNLKERLFSFTIAYIDLFKRLPENQINLVLGRQALRSVTSTGANYEEADGATTRREFSRKADLVKQELKESLYWFKLLGRENSQLASEFDKLISEADELIKIFATIVIKTKNG